MTSLELLYLGGNQISAIHPALGTLAHLRVLYLGDNRISALPASLQGLVNLSAFNLHNNRLRALPQELLNLKQLEQLSLRGNPLVNDFVHEGPDQMLSLTEICARYIKNKKVSYSHAGLPTQVISYLDSAKCCTNPACDGVYFTYHSKTVDFVDFCGKYRLPLLKYLCAQCPSDEVPPSPRPSDSPAIDRVLLKHYTEPAFFN